MLNTGIEMKKKHKFKSITECVDSILYSTLRTEGIYYGEEFKTPIKLDLSIVYRI